MILYGESGVEAIAAMNDRGAFVSVAPPVPEGVAQKPAAKPRRTTTRRARAARLYASLYETARAHDLPRSTVEDLVRIFGYDVDFQRRVAPGDGIERSTPTTRNPAARPSGPTSCSRPSTSARESRRIYRFQSPDDGASTTSTRPAGRSRNSCCASRLPTAT